MNAFEEYIYERYFNYGTSIREDCCSFIEGEISFNELVKHTYRVSTKKLLRDMRARYGAAEVRYMLWLIWNKRVEGLKKPSVK